MHAHGPQRTSTVLLFSLAATLLYVVVTLIAGIHANSLALISEAGHNASDLLALMLSWVAVYFQSRPPTSTKTFGYHRAGVLAAFVNALSLVVIACFIFHEAWERLRTPETVQPALMIVVAAGGVVLNVMVAALLIRTSHDVNIRSAFAHQMGDAVSSAAVIIGGAAILLTGQTWIDPALSFGIGGLILWSSFSIIRETLNILLEGTPHGIKLEEIASEIEAHQGVIGVHDLHVWSLGSEISALSCHIMIADIPPSESESILRDVNDRLQKRFGIHHTTIQFEHAICDIAHGCVIPASGHPLHGHTGSGNSH